MISRNKQREYLKALQELERQATGGLYDELEGLIEAFISAAAEDERSPFRDQITELINTRLELVNPEIKQLAVETFNSLALDIKAQEIKGIEGYTTPLVAVDHTVRSAAEKLFCDTPDREGYVGRVRDFVSREIRRTAAENMMEAVEVSNGRRRGQDLRFARVPQGRETCMFCIMLASRGFVYHSRYKAGELNHYHSHCDCLILPGYKDQTEYEGYDQKLLYKQWKLLEQAQEPVATDLYTASIKEIRKEAEDLDREFEALKAEYRDKNMLKFAGRDYIRDLGLNIGIENNAFPAGKEIQVARWMDEKGFNVGFLARHEQFKSPDIKFNSQNCDIKRVESSQASAVFRNLVKASKQASTAIIDLSCNTEIDLNSARVEMASAVAKGVVSEAYLIKNKKLYHFK